jgi:hypothetical protein
MSFWMFIKAVMRALLNESSRGLARFQMNSSYACILKVYSYSVTTVSGGSI